ncbi:hypothetical protein ABIA24_006314 [Sinorhizobium fredii]
MLWCERQQREASEPASRHRSSPRRIAHPRSAFRVGCQSATAVSGVRTSLNQATGLRITLIKGDDGPRSLISDCNANWPLQ